MSSQPPAAKKTLQDIGVRPSKGRGQNFLEASWVVERMTEELGAGPNDTVVEVGPGLGALTHALLDTGATVQAIEIEPALADFLQHTFSGRRLRVIVDDARTVDISTVVPVDQPYMLAANLPYASAPVILRHFLESEHPPTRSICMVQREVAQRMAATPPDLSILGIGIQVFAIPALLFDVPPEAFVPRPKVMSSVVLLQRRPVPAVPSDELPAFFRLVTAGFAQKRKTVLNSVSASLPADREVVRDALQEAGVDPMRRAETLSIDEWLAVLRRLGTL